jgi:RimJ/RimL family protein N-acetyltransferase
MDITLRPATAADAAAIARLIDLEQSQAVTGNPPRPDDSARPAGYLARHGVALAGAGSLLGFSWASRAPWRPEGWFELQVTVEPGQRRRGIGSALAAEGLAFLASLGALTIQGQVRDDDAAALRFAQRHGFVISQHFFTMVLDLADFDAAALLPVVAEAEAAGFSFFTFADAAGQPGAAHKLYELNRRLAPDLPGNDDSFPSFEQYAHEILGADWFRPEGQFIAADGERWVGLVGMGFDDELRQLSHEFSAVDRAYRGRRLGQALKIKSALLAQDLNMERIVTGNDVSNAAIVAVNRKLGYRQQPGICKLLRQ